MRRRARQQHYDEGEAMTMTTSLEGIDLLASTWGRGVPNDQFDRLRREAPVCWKPEPGDTGFWAVTKHADVRTVSKARATVSSEDRKSVAKGKSVLERVNPGGRGSIKNKQK